MRTPIKWMPLCLSIAILAGAVPAWAAEDASSAGYYRVGVVQLISHQSLDAATEGFLSQLRGRVSAAGGTVEFDVRNASGDSAACAAIAQAFAADDVDLILANAAPALQAARAATGEIPILAVSVSDYGAALGRDDWRGTTGRNISGTTDFIPPEQYVELIAELIPDAGQVGLLYGADEAYDAGKIAQLKTALAGRGYRSAEFPFADSTDLLAAAQRACQGSDVLYIPANNTAAVGAAALRNIVVPAGVPVISEAEAISQVCGVAALAVDYRALGSDTGDMAYEILVEGRDPGQMEIRSASSYQRVYNRPVCAELGLKLPHLADAFADIPQNAYYRDTVQWAMEREIASGVRGDEFAPDQPCTRAQVLTFLWRAMGFPAPAATQSPFLDVSLDAYYGQAVLWAAEQGITGGTSRAVFSPDRPVTRGQAVMFLWRAAGRPAVSIPNPFTDVAPGGEEADAVLWAVSRQITGGKAAGQFAPSEACTRAQVVTFLYRAFAG